MGQSPFGRRTLVTDFGAGRRRSTRVEYVTPVILTGRDASGQVFREKTETSMVNLHGAKLKTSHPILVGMQVGIEVPLTGKSGKAICVRVEKPTDGEGKAEIAVQLVQPENIWGLQDVPADWESGTSAAGTGEQAPPVAAPPPSTAQAAEGPQLPEQLIESLLQMLRIRAEQVAGAVLKNFEARLKILEGAGETRLVQQGEKAYKKFDSSVDNLRVDVGAQLAALAQGLLHSTEESMRSKINALFSSVLKPPAGVVPGKKPDPSIK